ncbi:nucleoside 2-deoxyribosyltransferase domain-containing protein [Saccharopolyspora sp. K220]|uniref:nucleoside 2-deoxyribosyltransferase domain-containing protein n=1 Tax=Saccharopolyspora soli TaxID=2926618 RepID=UPI001F5A1FA6|nr:nucleoside 2-deoxyribosyltransferase domain-containing protein [Saccharopolyspora soli]MCI2422873.1 nucleoside 2-deoxyribosyltransferase domain-containing protein [Saccharopolyspora soli]
MAVEVVYAREPIPAGCPSVMLLGPTPRAGTVPSWRPPAIDLLAERWRGVEPLVVLSPESRGGKRAEHYDDQVESELAMIQAATVRMFWIPRCLKTLPGFTTNVEAGMCFAKPERMVLGCPLDCPDPIRNRYLIWHAQRLGIPVCTTLSGTVDTTLNRLQARLAVAVGR